MTALVPVNGTLTTVGAGTLTATLLLGQYITRTGPAGSFADTFDTAANIVAAISQSSGGNPGAAWEAVYYNNSGQTATLTAPAGGNFTLNGASATINTGVSANLLVSITAGGAVTVTVINRYTSV